MSRFYKGPNDRCYALITSKKSWSRAHEECTKIDKEAYLVIIPTNSELDWISDNLKYAPGIPFYGLHKSYSNDLLFNLKMTKVQKLESNNI